MLCYKVILRVQVDVLLIRSHVYMYSKMKMGSIAEVVVAAGVADGCDDNDKLVGDVVVGRERFAV